jgi:hypothetical protein
MKTIKTVMAAMAGAAVLVSAGAAGAATVYDLNVYDSSAGFTGSLGTVTVSGQGTSTLSFDVSLNSNVFFQMTGNGSANDAFWFDLQNANNGHAVYEPIGISISSPNGSASGTGDYPTGGRFAASYDLGHGWSSGDYGLTVSDSSAGSNLNYYSGHLVFTAGSYFGTPLELDSSMHNGATVFGGADLRQCPGTNPKSGSCVTGPVGFSLVQQAAAVPEPSTWAIMLMGFGGLGAMLRQRRQVALVRA